MSLKAPALCGGPARDAHEWIATLDRYHGQATGVPAGDECLAGLTPTQGTELCAVVEYMYSLEVLLRQFGSPSFVDRLERIGFNALPAATTPDMWSHQYDQQVNQVLCTPAPRSWTTNGDDSNIFGLEPNYGCCTANLHQGWPKLVASLWAATSDGGLAIHSLAPCSVAAQLAAGAIVAAAVDSDYPFRHDAVVTVSCEPPTQFPLIVRIPGWAQAPTVTVNGELVGGVAAGEYVRIERIWRTGDSVRIDVPAEVVIEQRPTGGYVVRRGALLFSLRIAEGFDYIKGEPPHADWAVHPMSAWNYGLAVDPGAPAESLTATSADVTAVPFDPQHPPVVITSPARRVADWHLEDNSAGPVPVIPAESDAPIEIVELLPYGSTHLRVTELPLVTA